VNPEAVRHVLRMIVRTWSIPLKPKLRRRVSGSAVDDVSHRDQVAGVYFLKSSYHLDVLW
jgi:hypothetical protein